MSPLRRVMLRGSGSAAWVSAGLILRQRCPRVRSTAGCPGAFESGIPSRLAKGLVSEQSALAYQSPTPAARYAATLTELNVYDGAKNVAKRVDVPCQGPSPATSQPKPASPISERLMRHGVILTTRRRALGVHVPGVRFRHRGPWDPYCRRPRRDHETLRSHAPSMNSARRAPSMEAAGAGWIHTTRVDRA
jgi:hypothetical protein